MPKYQLPGFKAVRPQRAINILHTHMWTMVIFSGWKRLANYNKIVDVAGYKIVNVYKPPRSRLTPTPIPTFTPQPVRWRLQLPARQLGLQHNIPGRWEPGLLGNIQQPWTVVQPKGSSQFLISPLERWHQPRPGLRDPRQGQSTAG